ncbi:hypothetical protein D7X25_15595 [bacterium 1XD42-8]|nr:hypothetical protein D7X25_15595 [bacterium 1XD42-8]
MYYSTTYQFVFSKYLSYVSTTYILNSTVFSVKNNELIIFGKTLDNVKEKAANFLGAFKEHCLFGQKGAFASLFHNDKQKNLSYPELFTQFDQFKEKFNSSTLSAEALAEQMGNVDSSIVHYAKTCKNGEMTTSGFKESINSLSLSAKAGKLALHALSMAGNIAVSIGISKLIEGIYHLTKLAKLQEKFPTNIKSFGINTSFKKKFLKIHPLTLTKTISLISCMLLKNTTFLLSTRMKKAKRLR